MNKTIIKIGALFLFLCLSHGMGAGTIDSLHGPAQIYAAGTYSVHAAYNSDEAGTMVLSLEDDGGNTFGTVSSPVQTGTSGTVDLNIEVVNSPPVGNNYVWKAELYGSEGPSGLPASPLLLSGWMNVIKLPSGAFRITTSRENRYKIEISNVDGKLVKKFSSNGPRPCIWKPAGSTGIHLIRAVNGKDTIIRRVLVL